MMPAPTRRGLLALALATAAAPAAPIPATATPPIAPAPTPAPPPAARWLPGDYQDEIIYHTSGDPSEWLIPRGSGHVLANEYGDEPHDDAPPLADGAILDFDCVTDHGTGTLTVHHAPDDDEDEAAWQRWTLDPPMPAAPRGAQMHLCQEDEVENCGIDPGMIADNLDPGTYTVKFYAWGSRRFRYDATAAAMVPLPAKGGAS